MVDLQTQYHRLKNEIDNAVIQSLEAGQYVKGPQVKTFEQNLGSYLRVKHTISCANGTDALQIALMALGLQAGDEVITASHTYAATAEVIALLGLVPVFVEVDKSTFTISPSAVKDAITNKTKAIIPVHLYGQCADMEPILQLAKAHQLFVIEDNAQAIGAEYTFSNGSKAMAGTMGNIGTTSFYPSKNLGAYGDGGAIFTNDDELANRIRMIANHGQSTLYIHDIVGVNSRLDTIQAAILDVKLKYLPEFIESRQKLASIYDAELANVKGIQIPFRATNTTHVFHQYTLIVEAVSRDVLKKQLLDKGIPTMIYYPVPQHLQKAYGSAEKMAGVLKTTEYLTQHVISLPMHTEMELEQALYITGTLKSLLGQ